MSDTIPERRTLTINGETRTVRASTVTTLLAELGHDPLQRGIAIAVNDEVVPRSRWSERILREGDRVELVSAVQGG